MSERERERSMYTTPWPWNLRCWGTYIYEIVTERAPFLKFIWLWTWRLRSAIWFQYLVNPYFVDALQTPLISKLACINNNQCIKLDIHATWLVLSRIVISKSKLTSSTSWRSSMHFALLGSGSIYFPLQFLLVDYNCTDRSRHYISHT